MTDKELEDLVYNYTTVSKYGLLNSEIKQLINDNFKNIPFNWNKYYDAMMGNTCMTLGDKTIKYHCDVLTGIKCGLEDRDIKLSEWD